MIDGESAHAKRLSAVNVASILDDRNRASSVSPGFFVWLGDLGWGADKRHALGLASALLTCVDCETSAPAAGAPEARLCAIAPR